MKDKKKSNTSINDLLNEYRDIDDVQQKQKIAEVSSLKESVLEDEEFEYINEYNLNIKKLDQDYATLQPVSDILVRVFLRSPEKTPAGLYKPFKKMVQIPTRAGVGSWAEVESPFPYSTKAVVVAVPEGSAFKPGQVVQLANDPVEAQVVGNGEEAFVRIKHGYMHPNSKLNASPKNPSHKDYGYLLVTSYEIKMILPNE